jgi:hypothetical protein
LSWVVKNTPEKMADVAAVTNTLDEENIDGMVGKPHAESIYVGSYMCRYS